MRSIEERNKLFDENKKLVYECMNKFDVRESDREDVEQECMLTLWKCTDKWDGKSSKFCTYAYNSITRTIGAYFLKKAGVTGTGHSINQSYCNRVEGVILKNKDKEFSEIEDILKRDYPKYDRVYAHSFYNRTIFGNTSVDAIMDKRDESVNIESETEEKALVSSLFHLIDSNRVNMSLRSKEIYKEYLRGHLRGENCLYTATGRKFGVSYTRVQQIVSKGNIYAKRLLSSYK